MSTDHSSAVSVTAVHTILPATSSILQNLGPRWRLGPMDHLVYPGIPVAVVFVYSQSISTLRLKRALELLLDYYPHLAGRLDAQQPKTFVDLSGALAGETGAHFLEATCLGRLDQYSTDCEGVQQVDLARLPNGGNDLLAPYSLDGDFVQTAPVFSIQLTIFTCGGCALGLRVLHNLCAANGFLQLTGHLAELYRNLTQTGKQLCLNGYSLEVPPVVESYLAGWEPETAEGRAQLESFVPKLFKLEESKQDASPVDDPEDSIWSADPAAGPGSRITGRRIRFTAANLAKLKANASTFTTDVDVATHTSWISTFDAVCAVLHQSIYRARVRHYTEPNTASSSPNFLTPINYLSRERLPDLPRGYFPNAVFCAVTRLPRAMLLEGDIASIARAVHQLVQVEMPTPDEIRHTIRWIANQPDPSCIKIHYEHGNSGLMISSWCKMDMYAAMRLPTIGAESAEEAPVLVAPPFTPISLIDRLGYILPAAGGAEGLDIYLALTEALWEPLEQELGQYASLAE